MTHADEGALQALADGELSGEEQRAVERHLDACPACRAELELLRSSSRELTSALALLDRPTPQKRVPLRGAPRQRAAPRLWGTQWGLARAAGLVLGFAAAASATIPGSPVRSWLGDLLAPEPAQVAVSEPAESVPASARSESAVAAEALAEAGISVQPVEGRVRIVIRDASPELRIRAVVVDVPRAGVFATGDAASARFTTGPGRIEVEDVGSGELRIELPRTAYNATVVVNGRQYLAKQGDQMRLNVPAQDSAATYVVFKVQSE